MAGYHKYVFDRLNRELVGNFEDMYQAEISEGFDSWHQEDSRQLQRNIDLLLVAEYNFQMILDIGCGKGAFTHRLKKRNNKVVGVDISETAISVARNRFPDICYEVADLNDHVTVLNIYEQIGEKVDLTLCSEVLSYLENWEVLLETISINTSFLIVSLYIPENPIGHVKSHDHLVQTLEKYYELIEVIELKVSKFSIIFCKPKVG